MEKVKLRIQIRIFKQDIIRVVIKGRLSLNELRYKQCFSLRSTKLSLPFKDFEPPSFGSSSAENEQKVLSNKKELDLKVNIEEYFWLKNDLTIKEWLDLVETKVGKDATATDYWK